MLSGYPEGYEANEAEGIAATKMTIVGSEVRDTKKDPVWEFAEVF